MRIKAISLPLLSTCILILATTMLAHAQQRGNQVVIEKSPFESAYLWVTRGNDDEIMADTYFEKTPPGYLTVTFIKIMKDKMDGKPFLFEKVRWEQIEIKVDPTEKGMSLSYTREGGPAFPPKEVVLHVPTEQDKIVWINTAGIKLIRYQNRFYEVRAHLKEVARREAEKEKALEEKLKEPVIVYPK